MPVAERRRFQAIMGYPDRFEWPQAKWRGEIDFISDPFRCAHEADEPSV